MTIVTETIKPPLEIPIAGAHWAASIIKNARRLSEADLTMAVTQAYHALRSHFLKQSAASHIVRMWNYIPGITDPMPSGGDRYMAFNAGRYEAMRTWYGDRDAMLEHAPAGTGIGQRGDDLLIHAMALDRPGIAVQNPHQTPAALYSARFGPLPPCFARATRIGGVLLVSGTAAIRGEETVASDLFSQLDVTLQNMAALPRGGAAAYQAVRIFVRDSAEESAITDRVLEALPKVISADLQQADLCRRDLLVEIEGVASDSSTHD